MSENAPAEMPATEEIVEAPFQTESKEEPSYIGTKHKVKVNGQEIEVPYEKLVADYRKGEAAEQKWQEASRMRKEVDSFLEEFKKADLSMLRKHIPRDQLRKIAEEELMDYIQYEQMTEEQKDALAAKNERDALKAEKAEREQEESRRQRAYIEEQTARELDLEIGQAIRELKASKGIPEDRRTEAWFVDHVARLMIASLEASDDEAEIAPMPAKLATERAWKGVEDTVVSYLETVPEDQLLKMLPRRVRDAIRKADVGEAVTSLHHRSRATSDESRPSKKRERPSTDDFFSRLDKKFG